MDQGERHNMNEIILLLSNHPNPTNKKQKTTEEDTSMNETTDDLVRNGAATE